MQLPKEALIEIYRTMRTIRSFEDKLNELSQAGQIPGFLHLYAGEEAVAAGVCAHLDERDWVTSTHRGHGHCIAKGVDLAAMMAELFGRASGTCKGKGGSMHIADVGKGMLGANGIVGGGIPLAVGAALTARNRGTGGVAVSFFGDGASNEGTFHESLNLASIYKLPVVFVAENNGYGEATPHEYASSVTDVATRAVAYDMPGVVCDGMDVFDVFAKAGKALARARGGQGPTLLECKTYRYYGHYVGDPLTYRSAAEADEVRAENDPLVRLEQRVVEENLLAEDELRKVDGRVEERIEQAVAAAQEAPQPEATELHADVYVSYQTSRAGDPR
ncbi:MAG: thiamine pyrophosphate-dependent dehydrogenase E1 component subunit alpha [Candidatus Binatia bacterium]